jgi:tetraacyldisaccharide 4'-kinase
VNQLKPVKLLEAYILDIIEDRKIAPGFSCLLSIVACLFKNIVRVKNWLYDKKILKGRRVKACVVSIGNIVAGGTGKTPLIKLISEYFSDAFSTAIVTRGYRSKIEKSGRSVNISSANGPIVPSIECGDEPYWLALNTKCHVWVGKDKLKSAQNAALSKNQIIFIDDGMQHRRLHRDFEIVLLDGNDPFGKGVFYQGVILGISQKDYPVRILLSLVIWTALKSGKS